MDENVLGFLPCSRKEMRSPDTLFDMFAGIGGFRAGLTELEVSSASAIARSTSTPTPATAPSTTSERRNDTIPTPEKSTQTTCPASTSCAGIPPARHF